MGIALENDSVVISLKRYKELEETEETYKNLSNSENILLRKAKHGYNYTETKTYISFKKFKIDFIAEMKEKVELVEVGNRKLKEENKELKDELEREKRKKSCILF